MADQPISAFAAATSVDAAADALALVQGGATKKVVPGLIRPAYRGAHVTLSAGVTNPTQPYFVAWGTEVLDTDAFWDAGSPTRLTIPSGISRVKLYVGIVFSGSTWASTSAASFSIRKNGAASSLVGQTIAAGYTDPIFSLASPPLAVSAADYFEARLVSTDTTFTLAAVDGTFFALEVVAT